MQIIISLILTIQKKINYGGTKIKSHLTWKKDKYSILVGKSIIEPFNPSGIEGGLPSKILLEYLVDFGAEKMSV